MIEVCSLASRDATFVSLQHIMLKWHSMGGGGGGGGGDYTNHVISHHGDQSQLLF